MEKDYLKYHHPQFLIFFVVGGFFLIYLTKESFVLSISVFGILSLLIISITKYLGKIEPFSRIFWIEDFSERYILKVESRLTEIMSALYKTTKKYFSVNKTPLICGCHFLDSS